MNKNVMKLFKQMIGLGKLETEQGILIYEGEVLAEGTEVFVENEAGEIVPAPDGTYGEYKVVDGKIAPAEQPAEEPEEKPAETELEAEVEPEVKDEPSEPQNEPETNDYEERIAALENQIAEIKGVIAEMIAQKEEMEFSKMKPAEKEVKDMAAKTKGALKYFE